MEKEEYIFIPLNQALDQLVIDAWKEKLSKCMESGSSRYSEIFLDNLQNVTCCTPTRKQEIHNHSVCYFSFRKTFSPPNRSSILSSMGSKPQTTLRDRYIYAQSSARQCRAHVSSLPWSALSRLVHTVLRSTELASRYYQQPDTMWVWESTWYIDTPRV